MNAPRETPRETSWTLVRGAARGEAEAREEFGRRYLPLMKKYLHERWRDRPWLTEIDDAAQEVFVECYKKGGALDHFEEGRGDSFRGYLLSICRNVASRFEREQWRRMKVKIDETLLELSLADDTRASQLFDRAWAQSMLREAAQRYQRRVPDLDPSAKQRFELLVLRFRDDMPIRDIARLWNADPTHLHREYTKARKEFREVLMEVLQIHQPSSQASLSEECERLFEAYG
ncbi:MAG: RNA polymerase sigma factor [Planctomycetota bacterium]